MKALIKIAVATVVASMASGCGDSSHSPEVRNSATVPLEVVQEAVAMCSAGAGPQKQNCYETLLLGRLDVGGVADALAMLAAVSELDRSVQRYGHVYVHAIGITAYQKNPNLVEVFSSCSNLFQSGCYHGVLQAHLMTLDKLGADDIDAVCEPYKGVRADHWLLFQCLHGLGHGLTMFYGHHLLHALEGCDQLSSDWDQQSCYGGAFMENIINATSPHHLATELMPGNAATGDGAADGHDERTTMDQHEHPAASWKALDSEDPHYPCSILEQRYLRDCYMMQTSAMLWMNGGDIAAAARSCDGAPEDMRPICYQSLGRDISSYTLQDPDRSITLCNKGDEQYWAWCYIGLVKNFIDLTARTESAFEFCREVEGSGNKMKCYEAIGEQIYMLHNSTAQRKALCDDSEGKPYAQACLYGARVHSDRPAGL